MDEKTIEKKLNKICKNCLKANKKCIKNEPYIGLCAKNDKQELIEYYIKKEQN